MTTTTVRPTGNVNGTFSQADVADPSAASTISDNSDATYIKRVDGGSWYNSPYTGGSNPSFTQFTLPAGNVVKSITGRLRCADVSGGGAQLECRLSELSGSYIQRATSGFVAPGSSPAIISSGAYTANADANKFAVLARRNGNWDFGEGGNTRVYEVYLDIVHAAPPTTSAVTTTPSGAITTTRKPVVGWTYTQGSDGSAQTWFRVKIFTAAQYGAGGFDPATSANAYDSGDVNSAAVSHTPSSFLANGVTYRAYVLTYQTTNGVNQPSAWTAGTTFNIAIVPPTPTAISPTSGSTVTTSRPTLGASVAAMTGGSTMRREWQFASDSGFTANLLTVTESVGGLTATPSVPVAFPVLPARRAQGVWYIRARALDQDSVYGAYSAGHSFTIAHAPTTTSRTPTAGSTIQYTTTPTVYWAFSDIDTDDYQTKYRVQLWKTSTPGTVLDSGETTSANLFYQFTSGLDATWKNTELRWRVQVWDQDNATGGYSVENTFYLRDLPVITVVPAEAAVITTASPLVTWSNVFSGGATQAQWKVDILRAAVIQETSGWIAGTALQFQVTTPVVTVGPTHQVTVSVIDSNGLTGTDTNNFTATYAASTIPTFTINSTGYAANGLNVIDWSTATADANFYSWKVLRRNVGALTWTTLFETQTVGTRIYNDYLAPSQQAVEYVVVQTDISIGSVLVESVYVPQTTTGTTTKYMLVCPEMSSLNVVLYQVHTDSFGDELEQATVNLIGRGRRIEYGDRYGQIGSLTASLRDIEGGLTARAQRLGLETLRQSQRVVYFRNPFGDVFQVAMNSVQFERISGVGLLEYTDLTLDYMEITA